MLLIKTMKRTHFWGVWLTLLVVAFFFVAEHGVAAKMRSNGRPKGKETFALLKDLEDLFYISQDLEENTLIYIKPGECFCSCRDSTWSCTDLMCNRHMKECQNPQVEPEQRESLFN